MAANVLVVDDEDAVRRLIEDILEAGGYETCSAYNGREGLRQLFEKRPELVITDVRMPNMDGYEFSSLVRSMCDIPIIMMTGIKSVFEKLEILNPAVDAYMAKPIEMSKLLDCVSTLLEKHRQRTECVE